MVVIDKPAFTFNINGITEDSYGTIISKRLLNAKSAFDLLSFEAGCLYKNVKIINTRIYSDEEYYFYDFIPDYILLLKIGTTSIWNIWFDEKLVFSGFE